MNKRKKKKKSGSEIVIYKSNELIESGYKFNLWEMRAFLAVLTLLNSEDDPQKVYRLTYKEFKEYFLLKSGDTYDYLRKAMKELFKKFITFPDVDKDGTPVERLVHIIKEATLTIPNKMQPSYNDSKEYVEFEIEPKAKPYLLQFKKHFGKELGTYTKYELRNVTKLRTPYAIRLYELIKQYQNTHTKSRVISIAELKRMFQIEKEYPNFGNLYQKVILNSIEMINDTTDMTITNVTFPPKSADKTAKRTPIIDKDHKIKERWKVVALRFNFRKKTDQELMLLWPNEYGGYQPSLFPEASDGTTQASPGSTEPEIIDIIPDLFPEKFTELQTWWGLDRRIFNEKAQGKTIKDIEAAILFTKERIRLNKAENPAGVFLDALANGYKTATQVKDTQAKEREKQQMNKRLMIQPLLEDLEVLRGNYEASKNEVIRRIVQKDPTVSEKMIQEVKIRHNMHDKPENDFRTNKMLRAFVISSFERNFPEAFATSEQEYKETRQKIIEHILTVDPKYPIERYS